MCVYAQLLRKMVINTFFFDENHIQMTKNVTKNGIDHEYQQFKTQNTNTNKLSEQSFDLNNGNYFF